VLLFEEERKDLFLKQRGKDKLERKNTRNLQIK
jgi:hypothetical protein